MKTIHFDTSPYRSLQETADIHWLSIDFMNEHNHDYWEFFILTDGACIQHINGKSISMKKGDGLLVRPNDIHYFYSDKKQSATHINVSIRSEFVKAYCDLLNKAIYEKLLAAKELFYTPPPQEYNKIIEFANTFLSMIHTEQNHTLFQKFFSSYLLGLIINKYFISLQGFPHWLYDMIHEINQAKNMNAFPKDIAEKFNYSYSYILRTFKHYTNKTLIEYMNQTKMANAARLLAQSEYTTLEIAGMLGFSSLSYFNQLFKKTFGVSPRQYTKIMLDNPTKK